MSFTQKICHQEKSLQKLILLVKIEQKIFIGVFRSLSLDVFTRNKTKVGGLHNLYGVKYKN